MCAAVRNVGRSPTVPGRMRTGGGGKPPPYGSERMGPSSGFWCVPAAGASPRPTRSERNGPTRWFLVRTGGGTHRSRPTRPYEPSTGGAEGPLALSPQQCEAWIECAAALIQNRCTKPLKQPKIPKLKSFTRFFSKNRRGPGGSAPGRWPQPAKSPCTRLPYIFSGALKPSRSMDCSRTARVRSMRAM